MMSNSQLVDYTKLSPNNSGQRTHVIDRITPHCVVGQCTAEGLGEWFAQRSTQASSNYGIDKDGRVGLYVEEENRSWCSSSNANDQRAITIECASDTSEPYAFRDVVYQKLIALCADICKRNGKTKLLWINDKDDALAYEPASDEMLLTVHRWFANKSCPGNWLYARMGDLAAKVTAMLKPVDLAPPQPDPDEQLRKLVQQEVAVALRQSNPVYPDVADVPEWWKPYIQELLDSDILNGGTPREVCATDVNLTEDTIKACVLMMQYINQKLMVNGLLKSE